MIKIKNFLKNLKLHESTVSTVLGFLVIVVVGLLVVNYFRNLDTGETFPTASETQQAEQVDTYTVAEGDTLWSISEEVYGSGYNWVDIRDANEIPNPNDLEEGQELIIPDVEVRGVNNQLAEATVKPTQTPEATIEPTAESTIEPTLEPTDTPEPTLVPTAAPEDTQIAENNEEQITGTDDREIQAGGEYTVVRGDSLWDIAVSAYGDGYRWVDIAEANDLVNPGLIHAGNVLTIPA